MQVGCFLYQAVTNSSIFTEEEVKRWDSKAKSIKSKNIVRLTKEGLRQLRNFRDEKQWAKPSIEPMLIRPNDWSDISKPFYSDDLRAVTEIISNVQPEQLTRLHTAYNDNSAHIFYEALNHSQGATEYCIDTEMLEFVADCMDREMWSEMTGLPRLEPYPEKVRPDNYAELSKEDRQDINEQINEVHDENMVIERNVAQWGVDYGQVHLSG